MSLFLCGTFMYPVTDSWETIDKVMHKTEGEINSWEMEMMNNMKRKMDL